MEKFSHLAVDGGRLIKTWKIIQTEFSDWQTCSWTSASGEQRWWQVQIDSSEVETIFMMTTPASSVQSVSVFLIELLPGTRAEYKQCPPAAHHHHHHHHQDHHQQGLAQFDCQNQTGEFVYIRDNRQEEQHLAICEVQVIPRSG